MSDCKSFLPQIQENSKVLILGSMPGIKSLEMQQYYAHPQNRFWKVIGALCDCPDLSSFAYNEKIKILLYNNFALWDTIRFCKREGSLDSDIIDEVANDIPALLKQYKNIQIICLNGKKSYDVFKKYFPEILKTYKCFQMPSTSPANAKFTLERLIEDWRLIGYV